MEVTLKEEFVSLLMGFCNYLKLLHWNTTGIGSNLIHESTEKTRKEIMDALDILVESEQAETGLMLIQVPFTDMKDTSVDEYIESVLTYVRKYRNKFTHSFQQSLIDDIEKSISILIYKIKYLR